MKMHYKLILGKYLLLFLYIQTVTCTECPLHRPYAYYGGRYCCLYSEEKSAFAYRSQDASCDGGSIGIDSKCCLYDAFIRCPGVSCSTPAFNTSEPCPEDFPNPYWYGLYCCKHKQEKEAFIWRQNGTACDNGTLETESLCCQKNEFVKCRNPPCSDGSRSYWHLSWYAEGNDNPNDAGFSRKLRSTPRFGLVLGRGYSMLKRFAPNIMMHLQNVGISNSDATLLSQGEKKSGTDAENFIIRNNLTNYVITHVQQWQLFNFVLNENIATARQLTPDFDAKDDSIRGVVIDLIFTNEYSWYKQTLLQSPIANNSVSGVRDIIANRTYWPSTDEDRFKRRKAYMMAAVNANQ